MVARIITKRFLTPKEAAEYLSISVRKLEYMFSKGVINQTRLLETKKRLYNVFDLDDLIEKNKNKNNFEGFIKLLNLAVMSIKQRTTRSGKTVFDI